MIWTLLDNGEATADKGPAIEVLGVQNAHPAAAVTGGLLSALRVVSSQELQSRSFAEIPVGLPEAINRCGSESYPRVFIENVNAAQ